MPDFAPKNTFASWCDLFDPLGNPLCPFPLFPLILVNILIKCLVPGVIGPVINSVAEKFMEGQDAPLKLVKKIMLQLDQKVTPYNDSKLQGPPSERAAALAARFGTGLTSQHLTDLTKLVQTEIAEARSAAAAGNDAAVSKDDSIEPDWVDLPDEGSPVGNGTGTEQHAIANDTADDDELNPFAGSLNRPKVVSVAAAAEPEPPAYLIAIPEDPVPVELTPKMLGETARSVSVQASHDETTQPHTQYFPRIFRGAKQREEAEKRAAEERKRHDAVSSAIPELAKLSKLSLDDVYQMLMSPDKRRSGKGEHDQARADIENAYFADLDSRLSSHFMKTLRPPAAAGLSAAVQSMQQRGFVVAKDPNALLDPESSSIRDAWDDEMTSFLGTSVNTRQKIDAEERERAYALASGQELPPLNEGTLTICTVGDVLCRVLTALSVVTTQQQLTWSHQHVSSSHRKARANCWCPC